MVITIHASPYTEPRSGTVKDRGGPVSDLKIHIFTTLSNMIPWFLMVPACENTNSSPFGQINERSFRSLIVAVSFSFWTTLGNFIGRQCHRRFLRLTY